MRRWVAAAIAAVLCAAALAGCSSGLPQGVDGDLTNHWAPPPTAVQWKPQASGCFEKMADQLSMSEYRPIPCAEEHLAEAFALGEYTGPRSDDTDTAWPAAYLDCERRADAFVGGAWHAGRLTVEPAFPTGSAWAAGVRWYSCEIGETYADGSDLAAHKGSLKGAMVGEASDIALQCFNPTVKGESVSAMDPVSCSRPHHAEFAGLWTAPKMSLTALDSSPQLAKGCLSAIARYTKVPNDSMIKYRTGWLGFPRQDDYWNAGDRTVQCYMWISSETMTGSYKGAGTGKLKIHYA